MSRDPTIHTKEQHHTHQQCCTTDVNTIQLDSTADAWAVQLRMVVVPYRWVVQWFTRGFHSLGWVYLSAGCKSSISS